MKIELGSPKLKVVRLGGGFYIEDVEAKQGNYLTIA